VLCALGLGKELDRGGLDGLTRRFQRRLARTAQGAWLFASYADRAFPTTVGGGPLKPHERVVDAVFQRAMRVSATDTRVARVLIETSELLRSPADFYRPRTLSRILRPRPRAVPIA
jgi:hypothetical protein